MRIFAGLSALALVLWPAPASPAPAEGPDEVAFEAGPGSLAIRVGGRPVATYVYRDPKITRPYFAHLRAPNGLAVTRNHPPVEGVDATDHAEMHPGLWLAFGDLGGADSWRNKARVEHQAFLVEPEGGPGAGRFTVVNRYRSADGAVIAREVCRYDVRARPAGVLLVARSEFRAEVDGLAFGDQEEMGFGLRMATPLTVQNGGRMRTSGGRSGEREVRGSADAWCDYSGAVDGRRAGLTLMPDPANVRPSWYHARDYGLLVANPFGRAALTGGPESRVPLPRGEPFRLGFGVLIHDGDPDLAAAHRDFLDQLDGRDP